MDHMIYVSMAAAQANLMRQDSLASNLANASTNGFRAELDAFRAVPVQGSGASTRAYALETTIGYDDSPGPMQVTGRSLDVAVQGKSWLAVQALDGTEAYTRMGSLTVDNQGTVVTQSGLPVVGDGGPIVLPPNTEPSIGTDGTISAKQSNGTVTPVGKLKLVTPNAPLTRDDDGLFRSTDGDLSADTTAHVSPGTLEGSNVSTIGTMVAMISAARQFEAQTKLMQAADQNEQAASKLLA